MQFVSSEAHATRAPSRQPLVCAPSRARAAITPHAVAQRATRALWDELALYPKPGLVSLHDAGAHSDMDASTFIRSLFTLRGHFRAMAAAGACGASFGELRDLGVRAEGAMLSATAGVNTHRGAIFALGLLGAAAASVGVRGANLTDKRLRSTLTNNWGAALEEGAQRSRQPSHGTQVARRYGASGARGEARAGFPNVFDVALPALREARGRGRDVRRARLAAYFALLECVEDTNVLYRSGAPGLEYVHRSAQEFRAAGGVDASDALERAEQIHRAFVDRGLSPGGCADLLACALFVDALQAAA